MGLALVSEVGATAPMLCLGGDLPILQMDSGDYGSEWWNHFRPFLVADCDEHRIGGETARVYRLEIDAEVGLPLERVVGKGEEEEFSSVLLCTSAWTLYEGSKGRLMLVRRMGSPERVVWQAYFDDAARSVRVRRCLLGAEDPAFLHGLMRFLPGILLMHHCLQANGAVAVHSAGVLVRGAAVVLAGVSGAGKSTISRTFEGFPGATVFNDDRVVVRETPGGWWAYGTPWPGELGIALNTKAPLRALCILHQSSESRAERLTSGEAYAALLPTLSIAWYDPALASLALSWCERLLQGTPVFRLHFRPDRSAAEVVERLMESLG